MMRRGVALYAGLFGLLLLPLTALGQPTETGETGLITIPTTQTLRPGKLNLGAYYRSNIESNKVFEPSLGSLRDTSLTYGEFVAGIGIIEGFEISTQIPYMSFRNELRRAGANSTEKDTAQKLGDVRVTPKFSLFQEGSSSMPFSLGFLGSVEIPTGSKQLPAIVDRNTALNGDRVTWEVMGLLDKELFRLPGDVPAVLTLNFGGLFPGRPDVFRLDRQIEPVFAQLRRKGFPRVTFRDAVFEGAAGLELPLYKDRIGQLDWLNEYRGNTGVIRQIDEYQSFLSGLRYTIVNGLAAQAGVDIGLTNTVERYSVVAGLSWTGPQPPRPEGGVAKERIVYRDRVIQVEKAVFSDINFDFDKATLTDVGRGRVYLIAQKLKEGKNVKIEIQGHTDYIGTDEYNKQLGLRRAETVKAELVKLGVDPSRMSTVSYGESKPLIDLKTPWARAVNRRTEFIIVTDSGGTAQNRQPASPSTAPSETR